MKAHSDCEPRTFMTGAPPAQLGRKIRQVLPTLLYVDAAGGEMNKRALLCTTLKMYVPGAARTLHGAGIGSGASNWVLEPQAAREAAPIDRHSW